jgi:hypothetical protein
MIIDLGVARNWSLGAIRGIRINRMPGAFPLQTTAMAL